MSKRVTPNKLVDDLKVVVHDAEALLEATAAQTGEKIQKPERAPRSHCARSTRVWVTLRTKG